MRIIVPNSTITNGTIRNLSAETYRRIDLVIGTSYHDDLRAVRQFLEEVVKSDARILADPAPVVAVSELGDSSVNFVVRPWVLSIERFFIVAFRSAKAAYSQLSRSDRRHLFSARCLAATITL